MENQKLLNILNKVNSYKFVTIKWNIIHDNSEANYGVGNETVYNTEVLKSNF